MATVDESKVPITITFAHSFSQSDRIAFLNSVGVAYTKLHPNVTVVFDQLPGDTYEQKLALLLAGSNPPDAGLLFDSDAASWIAAGVPVDIGPALKANTAFNFADFIPSTYASWQRGDKIYGIPLSTSPEFIAYNIDMFKAAGVDTPDVMLSKNEWTYQNMAAAAKAIEDKSPAGSWGYVPFDNSLYEASEMGNAIEPPLRAYGAEFWSKDGTQCLLNTAGAVQAIQLLNDMAFKDKSMVPPGEQAGFENGNVAMEMAMLSRLANYQNVKFGWSIAPLPGGPAGAVSVFGQAVVSVFAKSPHIDVATDFAEFLMSPDNVNTMAQWFPPARASASFAPIAKKYPNLDPSVIKSVIQDGIMNGAITSDHPNIAKLQLAIFGDWNKLWVPNANIQAVTNDICTNDIDPLLVK
jgi:multiple sugar transport system substrate-binding protein